MTRNARAAPVALAGVPDLGLTTLPDPSVRVVPLPSLTSLRFFAALLVVGVHFGSIFPSAAPYLQGGGVGVSFFYLLSGFILTWAWRPGSSPSQFYRRRVARILPMHGLTWAARLVLTPLLGPQSPTGVVLSAVLLQAWIPTAAIAFAGNGVTWSLSVEALFYAVFPYVVPRVQALNERGLLRCAAAMVASTVVISVAAPRDGVALIFPPSRLPEFVLGAVAATLVSRGWRPRVSVRAASAAAVIAVASAYFPFVPDRLDQVLLSMVPFTLLIAGLATADLEGRPGLRGRLAVEAGQMSFSLFITHQIVVYAFTALVVDPNLRLALVGPLLIVCLVIAWACYRGIERPLERLLRRGA